MSGTELAIGSSGSNPSNTKFSGNEDVDRLKAKLNQEKIKLAVAEGEEKQKIEKKIADLKRKIQSLDTKGGVETKNNPATETSEAKRGSGERSSVIRVDDLLENGSRRLKEDDPNKPGFLFDKVA